MHLEVVLVVIGVAVAVVAGPVIMLALLALIGERGRHRAGDVDQADDNGGES